MTRASRLLLALACWSAVSLAQSATGIVEGRVVSVQNNEGVARAEVILAPARINQDTPLPARSRYSAETDSRGNFSFTGVIPGQYQVTATHPNFGSQAANQFADPVLIPVAAAQRVDGIVIRLTPLGVIAGRILDGDGDPVSNALVETLQSAYQRGVARLVSNHIARSDDHGEYRLFGLFPGPYIVRATGESFAPNYPNLRGPKPPPPFSPTYFGDTTDSNRAAPLEVQGSGELRGIDIHLQREELFSVKGKFSTGWPAGQNRARITVDRRPNQSDFSRAFGMRIGENDYEISQLAPGSYVITGRVADPANPSQQLVARQFVEVRHDLDGVDLSFSPGEDVSGVVTATGSVPIGLANQRILLQPVEPGGGSFNGEVKADGTFAIHNVVPDLYQVRVDSPARAYIASIKIGSEELPSRQLDLRRGGGRMAIVLSREFGRIEGKVTDAQGAPVVSANVTIVPDQTKADWPVRFDNNLTDAKGRYIFLTVIPDSYRVYAWKDAPRGAPQDAAFRKPFEEFATPIQVQADTRATIDLKAITTQSQVAKP